MDGSVRKYGNPPYRVAVLHGGPGAPGYMAPVARELSANCGVLEPLQTRDSFEGQIDELHKQLSNHTDLPVILVGSSWGAVLGLFMAAHHKETVKKLILVGCAVFDAHHSAMIGPRRMARLNAEARERVRALEERMGNVSASQYASLFEEWADLLFDADVCDPLVRDLEVIEVQPELHAKVWADFVSLRDEPCRLRSELSGIAVPTLVIHGEHDPHPIEGIRSFLTACLSDVSFNILPNCGHYPWIERYARTEFFEILRAEISSQ